MSYKPSLYYFHDPMCSWCWGFRPVWLQVKAAVEDRVDIRYVLGGLAPDTDKPMPASMQAHLQQTWRRIQQDIPGTQFNFDFWSRCSPRRSTYPACRAIIATRMQAPDREDDMLYAIQQAYYLQARNPAEIDVLTRLAHELGLDTDRFSTDIRSAQCQQLFDEELSLCHDFNVESFPTLLLCCGENDVVVTLNYNRSAQMIESISQNLARFQ